MGELINIVKEHDTHEDIVEYAHYPFCPICKSKKRGNVTPYIRNIKNFENGSLTTSCTCYNCGQEWEEKFKFINTKFQKR